MSDTGDGGNPNAQRRIDEREDDDLRKQLVKLMKRDAARDAGLDLSNPQTRYFVETYQGDPEELASKAREFGFLSTAEQQQEQEAAAATAGLERTTGAASTQGAGGSGQPGQADAKKQQLREEADQLMEKAKNRKGEREEVFAWARKAGVPFVDEDE